MKQQVLDAVPDVQTAFRMSIEHSMTLVAAIRSRLDHCMWGVVRGRYRLGVPVAEHLADEASTFTPNGGRDVSLDSTGAQPLRALPYRDRAA